MAMFKKAQRRELKARIALSGPPGAGKTFTALTWAKTLAGPSGKIAVVDTERRTASKYEGYVADFAVVELESFAPERYVEAIEAAEAEGYDVLILDSVTHAWAGKDGILEQKDKKGGANSFDAWRTLTPQHNRFVDAMLNFKGHLIVTLRAKMTHEVEKDGNGKVTIKKLGMAPIQREGLEFEFDLVVDMLDHGTECKVSKSRCPALAGAVMNKPSGGPMEKMAAWLRDGVPDPTGPIIKALEAATDSKSFLVAKDAANAARDRMSREEKARVKAAIDAAALRVAEALAPANGKPEAPPTPRDEEGEDAAGPLFTS